jgi:hypothetical protein
MVVCPLGQSRAFPIQPDEPGGTVTDIDDVVRLTATPIDIAAIEFLGMLGATIAAASELKTFGGALTRTASEWHWDS